MATLIDTSVLIAVERGQIDLNALMTPNDEIAIAAITASELLHGVHRASTARLSAVREAFVEGLLARVPVLSFDLLTARLHARIWAELASEGIVVGAHDLLIAATALVSGATLATRDTRSFPRIPGLKFVRW
jgi:predicted nucleic acid-binding protein